MSKRKRRVIFFSSPLIIALGLVLWAKIAINRVEANAQLLAQTGQSAIKMLNEYRAGVDDFVASKDVSKILACYADDYLSDHEGEWTEKLQSDRDGVPAPPGREARDDDRRDHTDAGPPAAR